MAASLRNVAFLLMLAFNASVASRVQISLQGAEAQEDTQAEGVPSLDGLGLDWDEGSESSLVQAGSNENTTRREDVECFCLKPYIYADLDDEDVQTQNCVGKGDDRERCDNICQKNGKIVWFEGQHQTISFCGGDNGEPYNVGDYKTECQCFDLGDTLKSHDNKKRSEKLYKKGKIGSPNEGWMVKTVANFQGARRAEGNLKACYRSCPSACHERHMMTAGCAYPTRL